VRARGVWLVCASLVTVAGAMALPTPAGAGGGPKVPGKPTSVATTLVPGSAEVSWSAPVNDGGSKITGYVATATS